MPPLLPPPPLPRPPAPPSDPNTFLLLHFDDGLQDSSQYDHAVSSSGGATTSSTQAKFGPSSAYFDGGSELTISPNSHTAVGNSDFTIEAWAYPHRLTATQNYAGIVGTSQDSPSIINGFECNNNRWRWLVRDGAGGSFDAGSGSGLLHNQWTHLPGVRHNNRFKFYVNGALIGDGAAFDLTPTDSLPLTIGKRNLEGYSGGVNFNGYIDEVRLSHVARYTGPFTPAEAPFLL